MDEVIQKLQLFNRKMAKMEHLILRLLEEKAKLENELDELRAELAEKERENEEVLSKYEAAKLAKGINNEVDRAALHNKIDNYLKEIDICLKKFGMQE